MAPNPTNSHVCLPGSSCELIHQSVKCSCGLVIRKYDYPSHVRGKRHRDTLAARAQASGSTSIAASYELGRYKRGAVDRQPFPILEHAEPKGSGSGGGRSGGPLAASISRSNPSSSSSDLRRCPHCSRDFSPSEIQAHIDGHKLRQRLHSALEKAQSNKNGFTVDGLDGVDFGIVREEEEPVVRLKITRESGETPPPPVVLTRCRMLSSMRGDEHGDRFSVELVGSPWINPGRPRILNIKFHPSYAGRYDDTLELIFRDYQKKTRFIIHRKILATVGDRQDHEHLAPSAPYTRRKRVPLKIDGPIRRSLRPPTWTKTKWVEMLPKFDIPRGITDILYRRGARTRKDVLALVKGMMDPEFDTRTYGKRFQILLYLEEEQMKQDLDAYAMEEASLTPKHPRYELKVEGLAEGRPSVLVGDFILVRHQNASDPTWYQGRVHQVYENHVSLRFDDRFSTYRGNSFEVRFVLNRLSIRRMHAALMNNNNPARFLFPGPEHARNLRTVTRELIDNVVPINRLVGEDPEQLEAVTAIVNMPPGSPPFVVFGPPGTGKTVTIVEAMRQLLVKPSTRLLVCAPNNSAADLIAQQLSVLGPSTVLRLNSLTRKLSELPKTLHRFSIINDNEVFAMPTKEELQKYRVVVSTCITAGVPASLGIPKGFYTHIFVDEAGQAMEPTVMVPLKALADGKTNVILAGDNKQLGPIVHSGIAAALGLKTSYLARIMDREIYALEGTSVGGRGVTIIKLLKNFRSHPAILEFSNQHFYNNELQYCGNPALTRSLETSDQLPKKKFPLIFHGIVGKDQREASSPSFFNIEEATLVKRYCLSLVSERKNGARADQIAVITPYHAQRIKILNLLHRDPKTRDIKVGSVEEFQGQERRVVIISTVRSSTDFIGADITRMLGFVASPHRFNVAVTRAQALLIVVGNPNVLSLDPLWRSFLSYVHRGGGWRGKAISWDPTRPDDDNNDGYGTEIRQRASAEAEETLARLKSMIVRKNEEMEDGFEFELNDSDDELAHFGFGEGAVFREED
ncbi:hypothetical protein GYMLUDRAFT_249004 [Collybiopsis luxurians FD-317 M1]|uniref:RNA helicase n=1 Tax=Collybiopsis luxurians FD-317 M1 TaxID=944289 RepID=A0A0D0CAF0_9AGAR|nr:hypothetical protein GYMLUDRAFT_249004 [Collybiopsis luxurians FD-317 M1]